MSYIIPDLDQWVIFIILEHSEKHSQSLHDHYQAHIFFSKDKL